MPIQIYERNGICVQVLCILICFVSIMFFILLYTYIFFYLEFVKQKYSCFFNCNHMLLFTAAFSAKALKKVVGYLFNLPRPSFYQRKCLSRAICFEPQRFIHTFAHTSSNLKYNNAFESKKYQMCAVKKCNEIIDCLAVSLRQPLVWP